MSRGRPADVAPPHSRGPAVPARVITPDGLTVRTMPDGRFTAPGTSHVEVSADRYQRVGRERRHLGTPVLARGRMLWMGAQVRLFCNSHRYCSSPGTAPPAAVPTSTRATRTIALAISPYTRRGHVDSTFYAQQSMVKTIELMLGLPTMSLFDLIATDMRASFTSTADTRPYTSVQPTQSLFQRNPALTAMSGPMRRAAEQTLTMRFDVPDAAPTALLHRITWGMVRGWDVPYPDVKQGVFTPLAVDLEDDERE